MTRRGVLVLLLGCLGLGLLTFSVVAKPIPAVLYNPSDSAEIGWYRVQKADNLHRGDVVAAWLPEEAARLAYERGYLPQDTPVIKTIGAMSGDEVCWSSGALFLPEQPPLTVYQFDGLGRRLGHWMEGCARLKEEEVFLLSRRSGSSFDSRYFGPVSQDNILGIAVFVGPSLFGISGSSRNRLRARAEGADCKIKAHSAKEQLAPCLHVIFYSAMGENTALLCYKIANAYRHFEQRYFSSVHNSRCDCAI